MSAYDPKRTVVKRNGKPGPLRKPAANSFHCLEFATRHSPHTYDLSPRQLGSDRIAARQNLFDETKKNRWRRGKGHSARSGR